MTFENIFPDSELKSKSNTIDDQLNLRPLLLWPKQIKSHFSGLKFCAEYQDDCFRKENNF
jgi:hypothetical protein